MNKKGTFIDLFKNEINDFDDLKYEFQKDEIRSFQKNIKEKFNIEINDELIKEALFGEGMEIYKIYSPYSSALQSLLIFSQVNEKSPITIKGITYNHVKFEYCNKVFGKPSAIDAVLYNDNNDFLFIESKFCEYFEEKANAKKVIGPSYFSDEESSYFNKLNLDFDDFQEIGINVSKEDIKRFKELKNKTEIKKHILSSSTNHDSEGRVEVINPIKGSIYVYSEGIRQILSHIIGIMNIKSPDDKCSKDFEDRNFNTIKFMTIDNFWIYKDIEEYKDIANDIHNHEKQVLDLINKKKYKVNDTIIECLDHMTYQDLYSENTEYFKGMGKAVEYYNLKS